MSLLFNVTKDRMGTSGAKLLTNVINVYLVDTADYTVDADHAVLADLPVAARVAGPIALTGKTMTDGAFDSDDFSFPSVTGDPSEAVVLHDATDDVLVGYFDGLTLTPTGNNINGTVNAAGWFAL